MKNKYLSYLVASIITISFISFSVNKTEKANINSEKVLEKTFCVDVNCGGKRHYERSPKSFSMNDALQKMRKRYPNCKITGASDGSCK